MRTIGIGSISSRKEGLGSMRDSRETEFEYVNVQAVNETKKKKRKKVEKETIVNRICWCGSKTKTVTRPSLTQSYGLPNRFTNVSVFKSPGVLNRNKAVIK